MPRYSDGPRRDYRDRYDSRYDKPRNDRYDGRRDGYSDRGSYRDDRAYDRRSDRGDGRDSRRDPRRLSPPTDRETSPKRHDDSRNKSRNSSRDSRASAPRHYDPRRRSQTPLSGPSPRRDRSRDRKRERSPERDRPRRDYSRDRPRDYPSSRDDHRDHKRPRHDDDRRHPRDRYDRMERDYQDRDDRSRHDTRETEREREERMKEEEKQAKFAIRQARLAKLREKANLEEAQTNGSVDTTAAPTSVNSPQSSTAPSEPQLQVGDRMGGKFDPKEIARKARAKMASLDGGGLQPANGDVQNKSAPSRTIGGSLKSGRGEIMSAGIDMGQVADADDDAAAKQSALNLGEDEHGASRLRRLPIGLPMDAIGEEPQQPIDAGNEGESDAIDSDDEDAIAKARATAEQRAAAAISAGNDVVMKDAEPAPEDDEIDPLDAFMNDFMNEQKSKSRSKPKSRNKLTGLDVRYSDDEDGVIDALGDDDLSNVKLAKKTKDIPTVNHAAIDYEPFRKHFYTEPQELQEMSEEDVKSLRFELDDIQLSGTDIPKPVQKFAQFGLGAHVLDIISGLGYEKPTSIQAQAIPAIMSGRDVIGVAKTGSGKTIAFLLPMFRHIKDQRPLEDGEGPVGLIVAPTRELANQIHAGCKPFLKALKLRAACVVGGTKLSEDIADMKAGADIVVCTPGRLIELLKSNDGRILNLRRVTYVVMDEADRMFDMGFEPQITKVLQNVRPDRQCVLFSATFPRKMELLARKLLNDPVQITVGGKSVVPKEITQVVEIVPDMEKLARLIQLVSDELQEDEDKRVLVFVERQETADTVFLKLTRAGLPCVSVHGGREQSDREEALADFKAGHVPIMVATSVAARGLDVKQLTLVINFDVPSHLEDYVHRAGRTGRAGALGTAVTLIEPGQGRYAVDVVKALSQSDVPVPEALQKMADDFWRKVKEGTEKRWGSSGFGGHGLEKLAQEHNAEQARQKSQFRTADQPDDEDEAAPKKETDNKTLAALEAMPQIQQAGRGVVNPEPKQTNGVDLDEFFGDSKIARKSQAEKGADKPKAPASKMSHQEKLAALNQKYAGPSSMIRTGVSKDNRGPDFGEFFFSLPVNDMPQKARWAVTNRGNVSKVLESTGVAITNKGRYYPPGQEPGIGDEDKMSVLIEGPTEVAVSSAVAELKRLIREAITAEETAASRAPVAGRYTVV